MNLICVSVPVLHDAQIQPNKFFNNIAFSRGCLKIQRIACCKVYTFNNEAPSHIM